MSSLIEKVEELRKLEEQSRLDITETNSNVICKRSLRRVAFGERMLDVAPAMLAALALVQPGHASVLKNHSDWLKCSDDPGQFKFITDVLDQMAEMARMMEEEG